MSEVTVILNQIDDGDPEAAEKLLPLVYEELRNLAAAKLRHEKPGHMLQATALVHEAYLRLVGGDEAQNWSSKAHFFTAAANAMRRILVESARSRKSLKRGGDFVRIPLVDIAALDDINMQDRLIDLDEALAELEKLDYDAAEIVKLRLYVGLSVEEAGKVRGMSRSTAYENWDYARSWFAVHLKDKKG